MTRLSRRVWLRVWKMTRGIMPYKVFCTAWGKNVADVDHDEHVGQLKRLMEHNAQLQSKYCDTGNILSDIATSLIKVQHDLYDQRDQLGLLNDKLHALDRDRYATEHGVREVIARYTVKIRRMVAGWEVFFANANNALHHDDYHEYEPWQKAVYNIGEVPWDLNQIDDQPVKESSVDLDHADSTAMTEQGDPQADPRNENVGPAKHNKYDMFMRSAHGNTFTGDCTIPIDGALKEKPLINGHPDDPTNTNNRDIITDVADDGKNEWQLFARVPYGHSEDNENPSKTPETKVYFTTDYGKGKGVPVDSKIPLAQASMVVDKDNRVVTVVGNKLVNGKDTRVMMQAPYDSAHPTKWVSQLKVVGTVPYGERENKIFG